VKEAGNVASKEGRKEETREIKEWKRVKFTFP
jgi:hypothetical protein